MAEHSPLDDIKEALRLRNHWQTHYEGSIHRAIEQGIPKSKIAKTAGISRTHLYQKFLPAPPKG